jgi:hypothetical protein
MCDMDVTAAGAVVGLPIRWKNVEEEIRQEDDEAEKEDVVGRRRRRTESKGRPPFGKAGEKGPPVDADEPDDEEMGDDART